MEIWKDIKGFDGIYEISSMGRVRSLKDRYGMRKHLKILKQRLAKGYAVVSLNNKGKTVTKLVARLIAESFIPNPNSKEDVNHKDGVKLNNVIENLEWATRQENMNHAKEHNLVKRGSEHSHPKLNEQKVEQIKRIYKCGGITQDILGAIFGVSRQCINDAIHRRRWIHV